MALKCSALVVLSKEEIGHHIATSGRRLEGWLAWQKWTTIFTILFQFHFSNSNLSQHFLIERLLKSESLFTEGGSVDPFWDPVVHFWAPWWPFWIFEVLIEGMIKSKKKFMQKLFGGSNNLGSDQFPSAVGHFGLSRQ